MQKLVEKIQKILGSFTAVCTQCTHKHAAKIPTNYHKNKSISFRRESKGRLSESLEKQTNGLLDLVFSLGSRWIKTQITASSLKLNVSTFSSAIAIQLGKKKPLADL